MINKTKKTSKTIFKLILMILSSMTLKVYANNTIEEPYINITFEETVKESKGHGTVNVFSSTEPGEYANKTVTYGVNAYGTYMAWTTEKSHGGGFNLNVDKAIGGDYTIALKFSFTNTGEIDRRYKKIIDFQKNYPHEDSGFYFYNGGRIMFYPEPSQGTAVKNNEVVDLLVRRNGDTKKFEVYNRIGDKSVLCYEFTDNEGLSILSNGLGFFHDDLATSSETTDGGKVYSVKIWDSYIDVDDVWKALDKEQEDSISKYICKKIEKKEPAEIIPGWETYYECKDKSDNSYKYFADEDLTSIIPNIEQWKKGTGYIPQLKSFNEIIADLENKLKDITENNVNIENKDIIEEAKRIINNIVINKASPDEQKKLNDINEECNLLIKKINETQTKLKDIEEAVKKYSSKTIVKKDIEPINNIIIKAKEIDVNNLTEDEKIKIESYINTLEKILGSYVENPNTGDNINKSILIFILSILLISTTIYAIKFDN